MLITSSTDNHFIYFPTIKREVGENTAENIQMASKLIAKLFAGGLSFPKRNSQLANIALESGITISAAYELHTVMGNLSTWQNYLEA